MIEELFLRAPLVRWKAKGGLEEVYRWLDEGRDPEAFIDLERPWMRGVILKHSSI